MTVNPSVMRGFTSQRAYAAVINSVKFPTPEKRQGVCAAIIFYFIQVYINIRGLFLLGHLHG